MDADGGDFMMRKIPKSTSLSDQAYEILKESILLGELKGGDALPEEKYSKQLGISRTPFRDTLARLASEGLIIQKTGAPAVVATFTREMSLEHMELRNLLEVHNMEKVITKMDETLIKRLKENLEMQKKAIDDNRYAEFMKHDKDFHLTLTTPNMNSEFRRMVEKLNADLSRAFLFLSRTVEQSAADAYAEHCEIVEAIERKEVELSRDKMIVHLNNVEERFLQYYQEEEQ